MNPRRTVSGALISAALFSGGCAHVADAFAFLGGRGGETRRSETVSGEPPYGAASDVREAIDLVKTAGTATVISSRALRLPSHPLSAVTAFDYLFPETCGGHRFRVYELSDIQILEFEYAASDGRRYVIRDYISGPNPFIAPGLWTAYDHTEDSVADMSLQFGIRGSGILRGTYSQGPVTGLELQAQHTLGRAYDRALRDTAGCRG